MAKDHGTIGITFEQLHDTIQVAMGWMNYHLYEFAFKGLNVRITNDEEAYEEYLYYRTPEGIKQLNKMRDSFFMPPLDTEVLLSSQTTIDSYLDKYDKFVYVYDFGDWWEHQVEVRGIQQDYEFEYPKVLQIKGTCPPEDCGGVGGYEDFLLI